MVWRKSAEPLIGFEHEEEEIVLQDVGPQGWMVTYPVTGRTPRRTRRYFPSVEPALVFIRMHFGDGCAEALAALLTD